MSDIGTASTLPPPNNKPAECAGCGTVYPREEVHTLLFVGHMDYAEPGDQRLALYNCRCNHAGTFVLLKPGPPCGYCGAKDWDIGDGGRTTCCQSL